MKPLRPYMFNAFYQWCNDTNGNCHIRVQTDWPGLVIPDYLRKKPTVVLCIRPDAVVNWSASDTYLSFNARFNGQPCNIYVPMGAIYGTYDKVTGTEFPFSPEPEYIEEFQSVNAPVKAKPTLSIVK